MPEPPAIFCAIRRQTRSAARIGYRIVCDRGDIKNKAYVLLTDSEFLHFLFALDRKSPPDYSISLAAAWKVLQCVVFFSGITGSLGFI